MMLMWLDLSSALLGIIGSVLHAYDMFRAPVRWMQEVYFSKNAVTFSEMQLERIISINNSLPQPPYTREMIEELNQQAMENHEQRMRAIRDRSEENAFHEAQRSYTYGVRGMVFIGLAFVMQLILAFMR